jgi:peroxiredoxin Q/BCP
MTITIGELAPQFTAVTDNNQTINLSDYLGKNVVLYFYPKDDTSGCTKEACEFRDNMERISNQNTVVLGVSPDSTKSHDKFKGKYNLNFTLISDESKEICTSYGVWVEKSMYGKKYMGVERTTFIIDKEGKIAKIYNKVKVEGHVDKVIEDLEKM